MRGYGLRHGDVTPALSRGLVKARKRKGKKRGRRQGKLEIGMEY